MLFESSKWYLHATCVAGVALAAPFSSLSSLSCGQEKSEAVKQIPTEDVRGQTSVEDGAKEEKEDPFAIPEGASVEELFAFISKVKRIQPPKRDAQSIAEFAKKLFPTIITAADLVIEASDSELEFKKALEEKFSAYKILINYDSSVLRKSMILAKNYSDDERPEIACIAMGYLLQVNAKTIQTASPKMVALIVDDVLAYVDRFGITNATYSTVSGIARSMSYIEHTELAATLHEKLAPYFRDSSDERLRERADIMIGAARRLRLPGHRIELNGLTADGETFDWSSYKGKVVLVDFWASWCGPCLAELPNMKKNLAAYGDKGFAIVGINMDSTRTAFEKCVHDREISWVNLVSEEEGKTGWKTPIAAYYGITGIPTALLVDQEGKVVSLRARGIDLDKQLEMLLGPVEEKPVDKDTNSDRDQ